MNPILSLRGGFLLAGLAAIALSLAPTPLAAQPGPLDFLYTYSAFAYDDTSTIVEFDIEFSEGGLVYTKGSDGVEKGELYTRVKFRNDRSGDESAIDWITQIPKPAEGSQPRLLLGSKPVALPPGAYTAQVFYMDLGAKTRRDSTTFRLDVPSFAGRKFQVSDIKLISDATESEDIKSPFHKSGYLMFPNVGGIVGPPFLTLNTYVEFYNANEMPTSEFHVNYKLADAHKRIFYAREVAQPRPPGSVMMDYQSFPLDSLPSGDYFVVVQAFNGLSHSASDTGMVFRSFTVVNPWMDSTMAALRKSRGTPPASPSVGTLSGVTDPLYAGLKESELDEEFAKAKYIAGDPEKTIWDGLSGADPKSRFLTNFWMIRDSKPSTPENEARDEYYKRVAEAASFYSSPMTPKGWNSDRGRILLQYGKPDNIDRHPQDFNRKPYEIWTYSGMNYQFAFVDRTQTGFYRLVHSTAPGETQYENWELEYTQLNKNWKDR